MGKSSGSHFNHHAPETMLPPRQQLWHGGLQMSLSLVSPDARGSPNLQERGSNSDQVRESPSESGSSRETWPTADAFMPKKLDKEKERENGFAEHSVVCHISCDKMSLREVAKERVDVIAERMQRLPDEFLEKFKGELFLKERVVLSTERSLCSCRRWIGCDLCSHWTHTDCAIRNGQIGMGPFVKSGAGSEMLFKCRACSRSSELLGWVKDVFEHCAPSWDRVSLIRELDYVSRIFHGSEDSRGRKLLRKCGELIEKLKGGVAEHIACKVILIFFQELEVDPSKSPENEESGRLIAPQEAFNRIADVVQEAIRKMEMVAEEKLRMVKTARLAVDTCEELKDKAREVAALKMERDRKKQQIDELEVIVRLKQAEADMFELKASESRREAERLKRIALARTEKSEDDYASRYLKQRLSEAEAEKQYLFEKMKLQESSRTSE